MSEKIPTILVIEDEEALREFFVFDLEAAGFKTIAACDGYEATQILATTEVDAVVSDINLPKKSGIEILQELRTKRDPSHPVVILITGRSDLRLEDAYHLGINLFLLKPFGRQNLVDSVKRLIVPIVERWKKEVAVKLYPAWNSIGELEIQLESFEKAKSEKVFNLGQGGIFVAMDEGLPEPNEVVGFKITFEDHAEKFLRGEGVIRWVRHQKTDSGPAGIGVEILTMQEESMSFYLELRDKDRPIPFIPKS